MGGEKKDLSPVQVCEIIEKCAQHGVASLQWGGLNVSFGQHTKREEDVPPQGESAAAPNSQFLHTRELEDLEKEEVDMMDEKSAFLLVEDPAKFEELMREEEFEDAADDDESAGE